MGIMNKYFKILKKYFYEVIFIFSAFFLMAAAAYLSIGNIIRQRLVDGAKEIISVSEANVRAGFSEAEAILLNASYFVQDMLNRNAPAQEIFDYLSSVTQWMRQNEKGLFNYYGIYGYINGEFYDSIGMNPDSDYVPQTRPWYHAAEQSGASIGYTMPYIDWHTGDTLISAVNNIFDKNNNSGIIIMDIKINWLVDYVRSLAPASGILLNQNMNVIVHMDDEYISMFLQDFGKSYYEIAVKLRSENEVTAYMVKDKKGVSCIAFFSQIYNGWYMGITAPYHRFFRDLYILALILIILSVVSSFLLCYVLLKLFSAKIRADMEINSVNYSFLSFVNDISNIARVQTGEKQIRFFTNIDSAIPCRLSGDEMLLRQMLANLLYFSFKNTEKGFIGLFITVEKSKENKVWLKFTVTDTGTGNLNEDQNILVSKRLCAAMDGKFFMESEYNRGNIFSMIIMQGIESLLPFASVEEPDKKKVLVFEEHLIGAKSINWSLENMHVPYTVVITQNEFRNALPDREWFYIFTSYGLYEKIIPLMKEKNFYNGKIPPIALLTDNDDNIPGVRYIPLPAHTLSIANILNNEK